MVMNTTYLYWAAFAAPLLISYLIAAINSPRVEAVLERFEDWLRRKQRLVSMKDGFIWKWLVNPALWLLVKFSDWTDAMQHGGMKSGIRVGAALYLVAAWGFLIYAAVIVVALAIAVMIGLWLVSLMLGGNDDSDSGSERRERREAPVVGPRGMRLVTEGLFFDEDSGTFIDGDGRILKKGILFDERTGQYMDKSGRLIDEGLFFDTPTGIRVDEDGRILEEGIFFDEATGQKIDENGGIVEEGIFFDTPTGQRYKK